MKWKYALIKSGQKLVVAELYLDDMGEVQFACDKIFPEEKDQHLEYIPFDLSKQQHYYIFTKNKVIKKELKNEN